MYLYMLFNRERYRNFANMTVCARSTGTSIMERVRSDWTLSCTSLWKQAPQSQLFFCFWQRKDRDYCSMN